MIKRSLKHGAQTLRIASRALGRNKMRSFLTALGIIIGVGAVIAMVSIGEGAKRGIESRFAAMGTNLLFVSPGSMSQRGVHGGWGSMTTLKENDAFAILQECPSVMYISPSVSARAQTVYGNKNWNTSISGTGERYPEVRNWEIEFGAYFDEAMVKSAAKVCVLGADVKTNLFEDEDPIGKVIRVKKIPFKVLGVLKKRGESGGFGSRDDMITIPYTTAMRRLQGIDYIQSIDVRAVSAEQMPQAVAEIQEVLRNRHRIAPGGVVVLDDFGYWEGCRRAFAEAGKPALLFNLPDGAVNLQFQDGELGERFVSTADGFGDTLPIRPGTGEYQVLFSYDLPYSRKLDLQREIGMPVQAVVILV
ncbi:MAG: hypothetical protein HGA94_03025, partial [Candidatus Aminicenantes bacterium]|nr:hypothetical protein [Candidatus Aminicenantes bacterium]